MQSLRLYSSVLISFAFIIGAISCGSKEAQPVKNGVDAEILNLQDSTLYFYSMLSPLDIIKGKQPPFHKEITVDSNGIFVEPLDLEEGYYFLEFDHNKALYFIQEGKRLSLDFDAKQPTVKPDFSGKLKYESRYLFDRFLTQANFDANASKYFVYSEQDFVEIAELVRGKLDTLLVQYITNHPTGSTYFMQQESITNLYFIAAYLEAYPANRTSGKGADTLSAAYYQNLNTLNLNDTNARNNPAYFNYLQQYFWARAGAPTSTVNVLKQITMVDSLLNQSDYQDYLHFKAGKEVATWTPSTQRTAMLDTLQHLISHDEIKQFFIKNIQNDTASIIDASQVILEDQ